MAHKKGPMVIIGGHEEKEDGKPRAVLELIAETAKRSKGPLAIVTAATDHPEVLAERYTKVFHSLGVRKLSVIDVRSREQAFEAEKVKELEKARVVFFSGGDQLRITSQMAAHRCSTGSSRFTAAAECLPERAPGRRRCPRRWCTPAAVMNRRRFQLCDWLPGWGCCAAS